MALASVPTAWLKTTGADPARLNVNGGAIALGHPLGGSGTKLMTTLINALKQRNKLLVSMTDDERKGILQRLRERREQKNQPPTLPPALEPKKDKEKDPPKPMPAPVPPDQPPVQPPAPAKPASPLAEARKVVDAAARVFADTPDYTCKLLKRDAVGGKLQPQEEAEYAFRKEPFSVHLRRNW